jgi:prepilin-type processing-associated H-X9-DG protein
MADEYAELSAYLDGELSPEERRKAEFRLANDPEYAQELRALERAHTMIATAIVQPMRQADLMARVRETEHSDKRRGAKLRLIYATGLALALAGVLAYFATQSLLSARPGLPPETPRGAMAQAPVLEEPETDTESTVPLAEVPSQASVALSDAVAGMQVLGTMTGAAPSAILKLPPDSGGDTRAVGVGDELIAGIYLQKVTPSSITLTNGTESIEVLVSHQPRVDYAAKLDGMWNVWQGDQVDPAVYFVKRDGASLTATPADGRGTPLLLSFAVMGRRVDLWQEAEDLRFQGEFDEAGDKLDLEEVTQDTDAPESLRLERVPEEETRSLAELSLAGMAAERELKEMYAILRQFADAHDGRFPAPLDELSADKLDLFADTPERDVQYVAGLSIPDSTRPPEPAFEPAASYPDRLIAYEQLLARSGYASLLFANCLVRLHYREMDLTAEVDTMGRVSREEPHTATLAAASLAAIRAKDQNNLKHLGLVIKMFENEHRGYTPPGWLMVFPEYLTDPGVLTSPKDKPGTDSYDYLLPATHLEGLAEERIVDPDNPAAMARAQSEIPIVLNKSDWPDGGRNILFADGHVEYARDWRPLIQNAP